MSFTVKVERPGAAAAVNQRLGAAAPVLNQETDASLRIMHELDTSADEWTPETLRQALVKYLVPLFIGLIVVLVLRSVYVVWVQRTGRGTVAAQGRPVVVPVRQARLSSRHTNTRNS